MARSLSWQCYRCKGVVGWDTNLCTYCRYREGAENPPQRAAATELAWKLRQDPRVNVHERLNARHLTCDHIPEKVDIITCDASFIGLATVLPDAFLDHDAPQAQYDQAGLNAKHIVAMALSTLGREIAQQPARA